MALTPISSSIQFYSSTAMPVAPDELQLPALFVQLDASNNPVQIYSWVVDTQTWKPMASNSQNFLTVESFGWQMKHNDNRHRTPYHSSVPIPGNFVPTFSCVVPSDDPLPFEIYDRLVSTVVPIAKGTFPVGVSVCDAVACDLLDSNGNTLTLIPISSSAQLYAVPTSGHDNAPPTGEGFMVSGYVILA